MPVLQLEGVTKMFGAIVVTDNLSLSLDSGEALGVLGPNGAGKTTLFNLITGSIAPNAGRILYDGRDVTKAPSRERTRLGIARSFQIPHPFTGMSAYENVLIGATFGRGRGERESEPHALATLATTGLMAKANTLAGNLTLLDRKRLELARALATEPKLLLLDEIAGGLTEPECHELVAVINGIRARGVTIVWIEHVVHALLAVVDRIVVIDFGRKIADGAPREVLSSAAVAEIYMGPAEEAA